MERCDASLVLAGFLIFIFEPLGLNCASNLAQLEAYPGKATEMPELRDTCTSRSRTLHRQLQITINHLMIVLSRPISVELNSNYFHYQGRYHSAPIVVSRQ